jgi:hypothetical protein
MAKEIYEIRTGLGRAVGLQMVQGRGGSPADPSPYHDNRNCRRYFWPSYRVYERLGPLLLPASGATLLQWQNHETMVGILQPLSKSVHGESLKLSEAI